MYELILLLSWFSFEKLKSRFYWLKASEFSYSNKKSQRIVWEQRCKLPCWYPYLNIILIIFYKSVFEFFVLRSSNPGNGVDSPVVLAATVLNSNRLLLLLIYIASKANNSMSRKWPQQVNGTKKWQKMAKNDVKLCAVLVRTSGLKSVFRLACEWSRSISTTTTTQMLLTLTLMLMPNDEFNSRCFRFFGW